MPQYVIGLLGCALAACSSGGGGGAAVVTTPDAAMVVTTGGGPVYIVPAGPDTPELSYPLGSVKTEVDVGNGTFRIDYNMPQLLVGDDQQISLRGALDAAGRIATVSGDAGTATCDLMPGGGASLRCNETLTGVFVDLPGVQRIAASMVPSAAAVYVAVASRFSGEPIGIVELR